MLVQRVVLLALLALTLIHSEQFNVSHVCLVSINLNREQPSASPVILEVYNLLPKRLAVQHVVLEPITHL